MKTVREFVRVQKEQVEGRHSEHQAQQRGRGDPVEDKMGGDDGFTMPR